MATNARVEIKVEVFGADGIETVSAPQPTTFALGVGDHLDWRKYTVATVTYQAFTVPTGARVMLLKLGSNVSTTLKGLTGDTGIPIAPSSSPLGIDVILPLGSSPTPGVLNSHTASQTYYVAFL